MEAYLNTLNYAYPSFVNYKSNMASNQHPQYYSDSGNYYTPFYSNTEYYNQHFNNKHQGFYESKNNVDSNQELYNSSGIYQDNINSYAIQNNPTYLSYNNANDSIDANNYSTQTYTQPPPIANLDAFATPSPLLPKSKIPIRTNAVYRRVYSGRQTLTLEEEFKLNPFLTKSKKAELAYVLNLEEKQIKFWYQNRKQGMSQHLNPFDRRKSIFASTPNRPFNPRKYDDNGAAFEMPSPIREDAMEVDMGNLSIVESPKRIDKTIEISSDEEFQIPKKSVFKVPIAKVQKQDPGLLVQRPINTLSLEECRAAKKYAIDLENEPGTPSSYVEYMKSFVQKVNMRITMLVSDAARRKSLEEPVRDPVKPVLKTGKIQLCSPLPLDNVAKIVPTKTNSIGSKLPLTAREQMPAPSKIYKPTGKMLSLDLDTVGQLVAVTKQKRFINGKMTSERTDTVNEKINILMETLVQHSKDFDAKKRLATPDKLKATLMDHQMLGLNWLVENDKKFGRGILADDMGLGKTLQTIALIVHAKLHRKEDAVVQEHKRKQAAFLKLINSHATLIVAPASLINQWAAEIEKFVVGGFLTVNVFHGASRQKNAQVLAAYDVIITTFNTVNSELSSIVEDEENDDDSEEDVNGRSKPTKVTKKKSTIKNSVLSEICFDRIVLDEAHVIKNRSTGASKACCKLSAVRRLCLTGTPIHNALWDIFSIFRFLRVSPIDQEAVWKTYILGKSGVERLNALVKCLLIRRTKEETCKITGQPIIALKKKQVLDVIVPFSKAEQKIYDYLFEASKQTVKAFLDSDEGSHHAPKEIKNPFLTGNRIINPDDRFSGMSCILTLILRLRQACNHLFLTKQALDLDAFDGCRDDEVNYLDNSFANASLTAENFANQFEKGSTDHLRVFEENYISSKMTAMFTRLEAVIRIKEKVIIVSQWTSMLNIIKTQLKKRGISYCSITGEDSPKERVISQTEFNSPNGKYDVLLLSLQAGGVGLNLVAASNLMMFDLHWNPHLEEQAASRIHRFGQTRDVFIHKFVVKNTIENRVLELQKKKLELAKDVLEGAAKLNLNKLTNADLAYLFNV
uniref:Homeobox domain-containing protein n=1 Tax=Rhabditophanes sp. KR3021 TaxID=114890 RepID=A0AC35TR30_9BILA